MFLVAISDQVNVQAAQLSSQERLNVDLHGELSGARLKLNSTAVQLQQAVGQGSNLEEER